MAGVYFTVKGCASLFGRVVGNEDFGAVGSGYPRLKKSGYCTGFSSLKAKIGGLSDSRRFPGRGRAAGND